MEVKNLRAMTVVEIIVSYISLGWAFVMFTDPNVLLASWELLGEIASRWVFGAIALVFALVKIVGIWLDNFKLRTFGLVLSSFLWTFVSIANLFANGYFSLSTGFVVYSGVAVLCMWASKEINTYAREQ